MQAHRIISGAIALSTLAGLAAGGCPADLAEPFGVLDLSDVGAFVEGFVTQNPIADLNGDGVWDLNDVSIFVESFVAGCP